MLFKRPHWGRHGRGGGHTTGENKRRNALATKRDPFGNDDQDDISNDDITSIPDLESAPDSVQVLDGPPSLKSPSPQLNQSPDPIESPGSYVIGSPDFNEDLNPDFNDPGI